MVRLLSIKYYFKLLTFISFILLINSFLLIMYSKFHKLNEIISDKIDISYTKYPLMIRNKQNIIQYFKQKEYLIRQSSSRTILHNKFQKLPNKTSYLIYEYTTSRQFCKKQTKKPIFISDCPFQNCQFTCNSSLIHKTDAMLILYSGKLRTKNFFDLQTKRNPNQIWMLWHDEPYAPSIIYNKILFNWTVTYRLDSEISIGAYGITFMRNIPMTQTEFNKWINENYQNRLNEAVW